MGELAALSAALLWTVATSIYGRLGQQLPPLPLNGLKGGVAIAAILVTFWLSDRPGPSLDSAPTLILLTSGFLGIGLGDTAYLASLNCLGPRRALLLETLAPPLAACFAWIALGETLSSLAWSGLLVTLLGVAWTITERTPDSVIHASQWWRGLVWGLVAEVAQAGGAVLSRAALLQPQVTALDGSLLRLSGGLGFVLLLLLLRLPSSSGPRPRPSLRVLGVVVVAALLGTYLGIWLQQIALQRAAAGIAQTLLATSPLFVLPLVALTGERLSGRAIAGAAIAVSGIALLFYDSP